LRARGTSTLLNNALLSTRFLFADDTARHLSRCFRQLNYCASPSICRILSGREECDHRRAVLVRSRPPEALVIPLRNAPDGARAICGAWTRAAALASTRL
jgi:hypothetical protein